MATYVISDLHGHYNEFLQMLKKIKFSNEDIMYVLGDVIDKGPDSIKLLQYIMEAPNIKMCLGNHEYMMFNYLLSKDNDWSWEEKIHRTLWIINNAGDLTYKQYSILNKEEKEEIKEYIWSLPLFFPDVIVNDKHYYLTHSTAYYKDAEKPVSMADLGYEEYIINPIVWDRDKIFVDNKTVIHGHTINYDGRIHFEDGIIGIDCGAAADYCIGCLKLEDEKEFYVPLSDFGTVSKYHNRSHKNERR